MREDEIAQSYIDESVMSKKSTSSLLQNIPLSENNGRGNSQAVQKKAESSVDQENQGQGTQIPSFLTPSQGCKTCLQLLLWVTWLFSLLVAKKSHSVLVTKKVTFRS